MPDLQDLEARLLERSDQLRGERLAARDSHNVRDLWQLEDVARRTLEDRVEAQAPGADRLPRPFHSFLDPVLVEQMDGLLARVQAANDELAGMRVSRGMVTLAGDPRVLEVKEELEAWARAYVESRLAKRNPRDDGQPIARYMRLYRELVPALEEIAFRTGTVNRCFLGDLTDHIPWLLYRGTWAEPFARARARTSTAEDLASLGTPDRMRIVEHMYTLYSWANEDDLREILGKLPGTPGASAPARAEVLARLDLLAQDIEEMRPFLVRNFPSDKILLELAPGFVASWSWGVGRGIGLVAVATTREELQKHLHMGRFRCVFQIRHDGLLAVNPLPWLRLTGDTGEPPELLQANLGVLGVLHARLLALYSKVDHRAILASWRAAAGAGPPDASALEAARDEAIAASCQHLVRSDPKPGDAPADLRRAVRSVRSQRLFSILRERLGCEVRPGKGSEVVVYRSGAKHFRLGHHRRNDYVPASRIAELLSRLGIAVGDWLGAVSGEEREPG